LTPARRWWRDGSRGGSISSNNGLSEQIRSVLWKLAYKQLAPGDWKKLAFHWAFTPEQIKAIEHQYTGKSILCNVRLLSQFITFSKKYYLSYISVDFYIFYTISFEMLVLKLRLKSF